MSNFIRIAFTLLLACNSFFVIAQNRVTGLARDAVSGVGIDNVHISIDSLKKGTITNVNGKFTLRIKQTPVLLTASHLGYYSQDVLIQSLRSSPITINLIPKSLPISEVHIIGGKYTQYLKNELFYVSDFEFDQDFIWLTGYPGKNILSPELRIVSIQGKTLNRSKIKSKPSLMKDAFKNVHLIHQDSTYQLFYTGDTIMKLYGNSRKGNNNYNDLLSIKLIKGDTAIAVRSNKSGTYCEFIGVVAKDSLKEIIHASYNRELFPTIEVAKEHSHGRIPDVSSFPGPTGEWAKLMQLKDTKHEYSNLSIDEIRKEEELNGRFHKSRGDKGRDLTFLSRLSYTNYAQDRFFTYKPIMAQIFLLDDSFYIFEDAEQLLWEFDSEYDPTNAWKLLVPPNARNLQVTQDLTDQHIYLSYEIKGLFHVGRIDTNSGTVVGTISLKGFAFVENIQVYNQRVFFTHQSALGIRTMNLYSIAL